MNSAQKVLIMRCDQYDPDRISNLIKEGMEELGVKPSGRVLLKPNVVIAHPEIFPNAFTRSEFLDGAISATILKAADTEEIAVGERSGITLPTRWTFKNAGYSKVLKKHKVKVHFFDEERQVPVPLHNKQSLRDNIFVPESIAACSFLINLPKFKAHPWCRLTLSLKNFIGIQDDRHRLVDHNIFLEQKIADLQEVIQPKFIAVDAIIAGQKTMLTPTPFDMGAIIMGTNSCAVDTVCCHMVNVDPKEVIHLKYASERGFGPMDISEIDVAGDYPLEEIQEKTHDFQFLMEPIDSYFADKENLNVNVGVFPEAHSPNYCWGGCPGALQEAMHIFHAYYPDVYEKMKKVRYVVGKVDKPLDLDLDEKVIFVGNCTSWEGDIDGKHVTIESSYKAPKEVNERKTKSNDLLLKTFMSVSKSLRNRNKRYLHVKGCTVSVGDHVHFLSVLAGIKNVNFDPRMVIPLNIAYWQMRIMRFINRFKPRVSIVREKMTQAFPKIRSKLDRREGYPQHTDRRLTHMPGFSPERRSGSERRSLAQRRQLGPAF